MQTKAMTFVNFFKPFVLMCLIVVLAGNQSVNAGITIVPRVYKTYTLKNTSKQTANDLHVSIIELYSEGNVVERVNKAYSTAFTDPPQGEGTNILDWPNSTNPGGEVPAGCSDKIVISNEDYNFTYDVENTYFTFNGAPLDTGYVTLIWKWDIDEDACGSLDITNPNGQGNITVLSLKVYKNNDLESFTINDTDFPYETYTGTLVHEQNNLALSEGESYQINLGVVSMDGYELAIATVAPDANLSDTYFVASGFHPTLNIPTVSEWGLIVMAGLLLTVGAIVIRRRLRTVPA